MKLNCTPILIITFILISLNHLIQPFPNNNNNYYYDIKDDTSWREKDFGKCWYEETRYLPGEQIGTKEPCLNCTCNDGSVICYLKICPPVLDPPPSGCIILHKKYKCCPELICNQDLEDISNSIEARSKPDSYMELDKISNITKMNQKACNINGTRYAEGSALGSSSDCEYCYCIKGKEQCVKPNCILRLPGCNPIFSKHTCCPVRYTCKSAENITVIPTYPKLTISDRFDTTTNINVFSSTLGDKDEFKSTTYKIDFQEKESTSEGTSTVKKFTSKPPSTEISIIFETKQNSTDNPTKSSILNTTPKVHQLKVTTTARGKVSTTYKLTVKPPKVTTRKPATKSKTTTRKPSTASRSKPRTTTKRPITSSNKPSTKPSTSVSHLYSKPTETIKYGETYVSTNPASTTPGDSSDSPKTEATSTKIETNGKIPEEFGNSPSSVEMVENRKAPSSSESINSNRITPELEAAIMNITKMKQQSDYELDYDQATLPPSLPNLKIIPFVAADALDDPVEEIQGVQHREDTSEIIVNEIPQQSEKNNHFSPPSETEGGFLPREPIVDGPYFESKYDQIQQTTENAIPSTHYEYSKLPSISIKEKIKLTSTTTTESIQFNTCMHENVQYRHGELVSPPKACDICFCYYGELVCQKPKCPSTGSNCHRVQQTDSCCGKIVCQNDPELLDDAVSNIDERWSYNSSFPSISNVISTTQNSFAEHFEIKDDHSYTSYPQIYSQYSNNATSNPIFNNDFMISISTTTNTPETTKSPDVDSTILGQDSTTLRQESTIFRQHSTTMRQESTTLRQDSTTLRQDSTTLRQKSTTLGPEPTTLRQDSSTMRQKPTTSRPESTTLRQESTTPDQKSTIYDELDSSDFSLENVLSFLLDDPITTTVSTIQNSTSSNIKPPSIEADKRIDLDDKKNVVVDNEILTTLFDPSSLYKGIPTVLPIKSVEYANGKVTIIEKSQSKNTEKKKTENSQIDSNMYLIKTDSNKPQTDQSNSKVEILSVKMTTNKPNNKKKTSTTSFLNQESSSTAENNDSLGRVVAADPNAAYGFLKLSGCNIFGKMYRIGKIILELSGPCLLCKCTDVGVQCSTLEC